MNTAITQFEICQPTLWHGHYSRVMGDRGVFHLRYIGGRLWPILLWDSDGGLALCPAIHCPAAVALAHAVARAKQHAGGEGGGSFVIDEYGRVIVPASDGAGRRFLAGQLSGRLLFENPFVPQKPIDLGDHESFENGDPWRLPYIGIPYHLHRDSRIYFYQQDEHGGRAIYPRQQDFELIRAIRKLRPYGAVRIIITFGGLVLTKIPSGSWASEDRWEPVFVGTVNFNSWFEKE